MNYTELIELVNLELDWLRYYAWWESKSKLTEQSEIYRDLESIGYAKRAVKLYTRCVPAVLSSDKLINESDLLDIKIVTTSINHDNNCYSPLEIFWLKYTERRKEIIINLNSEQKEVKNII